ncbi:MAG: dihydroorotate dehydrogenase [Chloroflexi bacterium]|nr:MAG: dihydroorotate dehydrogenase [Chloroflexota bacterium]
MVSKSSVNLQTQLAPRNKKGLLLQNPVILASGIAGYGIPADSFTYVEITEFERLGAFVCKGTTPLPRNSNPQPLLTKVTSGLMNAIGLHNPGIHAVIERYAPIWTSWTTPVIVNISADSSEDFVQLAELLEGVPGVAAIEVNVSCPNLRKGGEVFGAHPQVVGEVTAAIRRVSTLPLIIKLSPNVSDVRPHALAAADAGADAISLINTITSLRIDPQTRRFRLGNGTGGLSGPAIMPIALRMVYEVASALRQPHPQVPIIGMGGISSASDALEFLMAGATAVQVGTAYVTNVHVVAEIVEGIVEFMRGEGMLEVGEIVGVVI